MNIGMNLLLMVIFHFSVIFTSIPEQHYYISPAGNDQNDGSIENPFATLERAKTAFKEHSNMAITVHLREGYYNHQQSFSLNEYDLSDNSPITISAYQEEDVHLIGGMEIKGFEPLDLKSIAANKIRSQYHHQVLQVDLKALGIHEYGEMTARGFGKSIQPSGLELYFDERPMTLARWPNDQWTTISDVPKHLDEKGFSYSGNRPADWLQAPDVWLHGYWKYDWADTYVKVSEIDTVNKLIVSTTPSGYPYTEGKRFYALNILEELDSPGEWYLNRKTGILYFWPPSDPQKARIFVTILRQPIIKLKNTQNVTIENLTLEYSRGAGVEIVGGSNNVIKNCILRNLGTVAVSIGKMEGNISGLIYNNTLYNGDPGTENGVSGCVIYSTGEGGVMLGGGDRKTLTPGKNFVENCDIYDCSRLVRTYRAGIFMYGVGNIVSHNTIHDLPHTAVFFWGNDHLMEYNEIYKVCMETGDAGAFYNGRDWTQRGSTIRYNYFHHLHGVEGQEGWTDVMAIYLDDWSSGATIFGNIFYKAGRTIMIGGGRDNIVENNIVIDGQPAMHVDARGLGWAKYYFDGSNKTLFNRLEAIHPQEEPYSKRYPQLVKLLEDDPVLPKGNKFIRNISSGGTWIEMLNGVDNTLVYFQDNMIDMDDSFYSIESKKYQIKFNAKMYPPGFQNIPFDKIGIISKDKRK